ncbi:protein of unknown function [Quadrisphaera granulorum]|uniref:Uncharacterized protein DUF1992 n=2 Tax=Quadrisphaera granulorum TaxID=317664 RepID=A0A315ZKT4_9ACTN|nr:uncharacterized protein DUF1992 [Quadrisphaera granulorum]SZE99127.1 protein of unknown function [Quadrisphaera granulorum]
MSRETWVDRQIREATERGAFEGLGAAGKPLDEAALAQTAGEWAVEWARREGADMTVALPPALALRREREELVASVPSRPSEEAVRAAVEQFNQRLDAAYRRPQEVPPVALAFVDVDRQLARWREAHPSEPAKPAPGAADGPACAAEAGASRSPWWRGGRRRPR